MNELIKQLATKAEFSEKDLHIQGDNFQRFAELIIQECATIADTDFLPKGVGCGYITYTTGERIKKHFGKI